MRPSKGQRRIATILREIPGAREQLLVAMEEFGSDFRESDFLAAAQAVDARERNRVAVIERQYEVLLNWLHELGARGLSEAQRLGLIDKSSAHRIDKSSAHTWERLAALGVISHISAERLQEGRELRDALAHAYPPASWKTLHEGVLVLMNELDRYLVGFERWAYDEEILPSS